MELHNCSFLRIKTEILEILHAVKAVNGANQSQKDR